MKFDLNNCTDLEKKNNSDFLIYVSLVRKILTYLQLLNFLNTSQLWWNTGLVIFFSDCFYSKYHFKLGHHCEILQLECTINVDSPAIYHFANLTQNYFCAKLRIFCFLNFNCSSCGILDVSILHIIC